MKQPRRSIAACLAIAVLGIRAEVSAAFPNIYSFTQTQDAGIAAGKLVLTYSPDLAETPAMESDPFLTGADINWINSRTGQGCTTAPMQHTGSGKFTCAISCMPGDAIRYFFTQRWVGVKQYFYGMNDHRCANETDTKWFTYVGGVGFEPKPK
jgi:hypothetical protein